mgnify:CR=1 FL=1
MLGALLALGIFGGAAAKAAYDNYNMKKYSTRYDENGNRHYFDRLGTDYINGEKIISGGYTDTKGIYHRTETGLNSNKVYTDYVCPSEQLKADYQKEEIQWAKDHNVLIANIYQPRFKKAVATELSTGKVIACMMDYKVNGVEHYRKFYVKPDAKEYEYNKNIGISDHHHWYGIMRQHPKISNVMNAWITTKKRLRLSSMSHFQDKAMPAY